ncbi:hypothetical protein Aple_044510 [Acrocarpospora pleiomorpha]|uniref:DUF35 domain-containing protein n=1 Tax=Acrocarpospora pleiomorpha TaxID=90975 RepID=A0A5M3XJA3_9ACTN|nr:hypothetical protein [Acrocarpospora pleiomorpha]GES21555.1 hypothetical protein Aple_044510 [Acrocarpospora pleiomorpha]
MTEAPPELEVAACGSCGFLDHPAQEFGCRRCGAHGAALGVERVPARGIVVSSAEVNLYGGTDITAPFVVSAVRLDSGPVLRVTMLDTTPVPRGCAVIGVVSGGELRFVQENGS